MAAPSRVGTETTFIAGGSGSGASSISFSHTTTAATNILIVAFAVEGNNSISSVQFNSTNMTLIRDTGSTADSRDIRIYIYGMVSPGNTTANVTATHSDANDPVIARCTNWTDAETSSVANATNFISEEQDTAPSTTAVLSSGGSSGNTLYAFGSQQSGTRTATWSSAAFTEIAEFETGTSTTVDISGVDGEYTSPPAGTTITWSTSEENTGVLIEIIAASGGDVNVSASTDALTLTEYSATVNAEINVAAGVDSLTLTENAATVSVGIDVQASVSSLTLTENAADVNLNVSVSASLASLTLTEYAASVTIVSSIVNAPQSAQKLLAQRVTRSRMGSLQRRR